MDIDISYIKDISEAIAYNSSSTHDYAENKLKTLKDAIKRGETVTIHDGDSVTVLTSLDELIKYKSQDANLSMINLRTSTFYPALDGRHSS